MSFLRHRAKQWFSFLRSRRNLARADSRRVGCDAPMIEPLESRLLLSASFLPGFATGLIEDPVTEASGLTASRIYADVFYTHNDEPDGGSIKGTF